mmetsp:Transcript_2696/g.3072  ORF Transcript_2696/g.3072 Transcript_2696/m.3072 type:complete len:314 (+) Transcript_2696:134-1075(+)|eukprot:CAMPEP_0197854860 /NCGR_PEP_ID=MMETSP1438-20131217/25465_1 /TAXON_ID=1461541 /ORGANISM="Pterosperma sp., Strain CCMP1384" /LENGTH=313 /DNA_ID=CAMNT_0043469751 /DNA_START=128 /DNA_END=1069 /DNA_ORIENTATION=+
MVGTTVAFECGARVGSGSLRHRSSRCSGLKSTDYSESAHALRSQCVKSVRRPKLRTGTVLFHKPDQKHSKRSTETNAAVVQNNSSVFKQPSLTSPSSRSSQLRVAVDVDEVLARFLLTLNKFCAEEYGMSYDVSDYSVYDFKTIWECSQTASNEMVHKFFESQYFANEIPPIPGALASLERLKSTCELVVVTSRQHVIQQPTLDWLDMHFPDVFSDVHFGNHYALHGTSRKKSEICRELGADVLIDDNPGYAMDCAEAGIEVLLFDWGLQYPWSKTEEGGPLHPLITRVSDWHAVEAVLGSLASTAEEGGMVQ